MLLTKVAHQVQIFRLTTACIKIHQIMSLKLTEELCNMTMRNDAKFEEQFTCQFKIGMRNLTNFDMSTERQLL